MTVSVPLPATILAKDLANLVGISQRKLQYLVEDDGMPRLDHGVFHLSDSVVWYCRYLRDHEKKALNEEKHNLAKQQRIRLELENAARARQVVSVPEISRVFNTALATLGSSLDSLGARMANTLAGIEEPGEIKHALFAETRAIRDDFGTALAAMGGDISGGPGSDPHPADAGRGKVGRPGKDITAGIP